MLINPLIMTDTNNSLTKKVDALYTERYELEAAYNAINEEVYKYLGLELDYLKAEEKKLKIEFAALEKGPLSEGGSDALALICRKLDTLHDRIETVQWELHLWRRPDFC